jgi:hypothetical protein
LFPQIITEKCTDFHGLTHCLNLKTFGGISNYKASDLAGFQNLPGLLYRKIKKPPLKIRDGFDTWLIELFILIIKLLSQNMKIKGRKMAQHEIQNLFGLLFPVTCAERSRSIQPILNRFFD